MESCNLGVVSWGSSRLCQVSATYLYEQSSFPFWLRKAVVDSLALQRLLMLESLLSQHVQYLVEETVCFAPPFGRFAPRSKHCYAKVLQYPNTSLAKDEFELADSLSKARTLSTVLK
jgi:hypothetical protein